MNFLGIIAFVLALLISVMIHEAGHFVTARHYGMKVTEFFLGFGQRLWSFRRGETEFGIKAIPAGGYCRIVGMSVHEPLTEEEKPRAFYIASAPKRLVVLGAGSFLHFVLGFLILVVLLAGVGTTAVTTTVAQISPCLTPSNTKTMVCAPGDAPSPAVAAGIKAGDQIISINSQEIKNWSDAVVKIRASANRTLLMTVKRDGALVHLRVTPEEHTINGTKMGQIGVINKLGNKRQGPLDAITHSADITRQLLKSSVTSLISLPTKVVPLVRQTFGSEKRDPQGLVGVVGVARVSGQTASDPHLAKSEKVATFLLIIASLNIFVGVFNLLPLLPLDGGHMAVAIADGIRIFWAKRRGKAKPAPIDVEKLTPITIVVFVLLAALSLLLLAADIFNPVQLNL
jgi:membrane-associated protease RseP (regulator of RpoE activity)